jgi:hypothetical protein
MGMDIGQRVWSGASGPGAASPVDQAGVSAQLREAATGSVLVLYSDEGEHS